ncbi:MAG: pilus (MSHA type) biogenesis protein MshL [Aeromonadaceae bacterium]
MNKLSVSRPHSYSLLALTLLLAGCVTYQHPEPKEAKQVLKEASQGASSAVSVPAEVQAELLPANPLQPMAAPIVAERRFRVAAKEVPAPEFFASLMQDGRYSVAVHPGVEGLITLDLRDVTQSEVLDTVASMYGFDIRRVGNVYHVYPAGLRAESFPVNYLMLSRNGKSRTSVTTGGVTEQQGGNSTFSTGSSDSNSNNNNGSNSASSVTNTNGTQIETDSQSDFWRDLEVALVRLVGNGNGRAVILNPQAGLVTVKAMPDELKAVRDFLGQSERHLKRQVILETKILEVQLNEGYQQGIQWSSLSATWNGNKGISGGQSLVALPAVTDATAGSLGGGASFKVSDGNFSAIVNLLKTQGDVNTLSSPRVTATNNQKAVIKVGSDEYFVTGVSSNVVATGNSAPVTSPTVDLTPFFSGIALDVTPQIDEAGNVLLHVHPSVIDVTEQEKNINLGNEFSTLKLPMAFSNIRESDTVVQAKSGDVIVIGGLMRTSKQEEVSKVPWLGDVPWFGEAFTNRKQSNVKTELVIMLKPQVVESDTWQQELQRSSQLLDKWYPEQP